MRTLALMAAALSAAPTMVVAQAAEMRVERMDPALDALIAPDARIDRLATGFGFTEGPLWNQGRLWFSDVTGDKMRAVDPAGRVEELVPNSGGLPNPPAGKNIGSNGMTLDRDGAVVMAQMGARRIARVGRDLKVTDYVSTWQGKRLNSPNDLVFARGGALWFTDPPFGLYNGMDKDPAKEVPFNAVWRYAAGKLSPVITDLKLPNGIAFAPDGRTLYVGDYAANAIYAYPVQGGGKLGTRRTVIVFPRTGPGGADGMKVDQRGNIWATGPGGIRIVTPQGKVLGQIKLPEEAANLAWGGSDGRTLYITASTSVYRVPTKVAGVPPRYAR